MYVHAKTIQTPEVQELRREAGRWLKALRESRGLSQRKLAERVGVYYYTFISQIEAGRGKVPPDSYEIWARALDMPPRDFVIHLMQYYDPITHGILYGAEHAAQPCEAQMAGQAVSSVA